MSVTGFDDAGARLLADALGEARRQQFTLQLAAGGEAAAVLEALVKKGRDGGEGAWLLSLELLQWSNDRAAFEDRAVEFAVTFELSPPSWEPPPLPKTRRRAAGTREPTARRRPSREMLVLDRRAWRARRRRSSASSPSTRSRAPSSPVDMSDVERIDFVCAGALLNAINRIEAQRKAVQIVGASPIIRALLLLIGISPRHFVKKAQ